MKQIILCISLLLILTATGACTKDISPNSYNAMNVGSSSRTVRGVIVSARPVKVSNNSSNIGGATGALLGGLGASEIGGGSKENAAGAIGGAIIGGIIGQMAEERLTIQQAIEYVVETQSGELITVVQGADSVYSIGQEVFVNLGNPARIIPASRGGYGGSQNYTPQQQQQQRYPQRGISPYQSKQSVPSLIIPEQTT